MSAATKPIREFLSPLPHTVGVEQTINHAQTVMRDEKIRHLPVLSGGALVGIVSDRDLGLVGALNDIDPTKTAVEEAMSADPYTVGPDAPLGDVISVMATKSYGSVLVTEGQKVVGIFTTTDAVRLLADLLKT
ncbi:MAG: CBS domain-containing protein [Myxococcota bacterium]